MHLLHAILLPSLLLAAVCAQSDESDSDDLGHQLESRDPRWRDWTRTNRGRYRGRPRPRPGQGWNHGRPRPHQPKPNPPKPNPPKTTSTSSTVASTRSSATSRPVTSNSGSSNIPPSTTTSSSAPQPSSNGQCPEGTQYMEVFDDMVCRGRAVRSARLTWRNRRASIRPSGVSKSEQMIKSRSTKKG